MFILNWHVKNPRGGASAQFYTPLRTPMLLINIFDAIHVEDHEGGKSSKIQIQRSHD